jgi:hypothetical protein
MAEETLVRNAADEQQVEKARKKDLSKRDKEIRDLYAVLQMPEGRRFLWRVLSHCKAFESIWRQSAEIHYLAGMRDVALFIMSEINDCDQEAFFKMMKEKENG